jgi:hypothetical protein
VTGGLERYLAGIVVALDELATDRQVGCTVRTVQLAVGIAGRGGLAFWCAWGTPCAAAMAQHHTSADDNP